MAPRNQTEAGNPDREINGKGQERKGKESTERMVKIGKTRRGWTLDNKDRKGRLRWERTVKMKKERTVRMANNKKGTVRITKDRKGGERAAKDGLDGKEEKGTENEK